MKNESAEVVYIANASSANESLTADDSEEMEMLNDSEFMKSMERAKQDRADGKYSKWEDVKRNV